MTNDARELWISPTAPTPMKKAFLKPGTMPDGTPMKVRKPIGTHLAEAGEMVVLDSHWERRLRDGDVVEVGPPGAAANPDTEQT